MFRLPPLAVVTTLLTLPVVAAAQTTWTGSNLTITGNRSNGCNVRVVEASHAGSTLNSLRFVVSNRASAAVRATADVNLIGNNQRKAGTISGLIGAGQQATLQGFYPFGGSLAGSKVEIRFTGCTPG